MPRIIIIILLLLSPCLTLASGSIDIGFSISDHGEQVGTATSLDLGTGMAFHEYAWSGQDDPFIVDTCSMQGSGKANNAQTISNNNGMFGTLSSTGTWIDGHLDRSATIQPGYLTSAQTFDATGYDLVFAAQAAVGTKSSELSITKSAGELAGQEAILATPSAIQVAFSFIV
jgi:hypothetical protein